MKAQNAPQSEIQKQPLLIKGWKKHFLRCAQCEKSFLEASFFFFFLKKRKQKSLMWEPRESLLISWMALNSSSEDNLRQCEGLHIRNLSASLFIFSKKAARKMPEAGEET